MTREELQSFICEMFNIPQCTTLILQQIHKYVTERGYEYIDIARALSYYVDVRKQTAQLQYGIKIVEYIMDDARKYFAELKAQKEKQLQAAQVINENAPIKYKARERSPRRKTIDINKL